MNNLEVIAKKVRRDVLGLVGMTGEGHIGPCFSIAEILVALYFDIMKPDDVFILSKGHACYSLYSVLYMKGLKPMIKGHPDIDVNNGISCTTGSLGHGLPMGVGMALAKKLKKESGRVFVLMGDGECQEGTTWESMTLARKFRLDNLFVIVDNNKLQALDRIDEVINETSSDLIHKFEAFGAIVTHVDGNDVERLTDHGMWLAEPLIPNVIIADTIKGKGVSFIENKPAWHAKIPSSEEFQKAIQELTSKPECHGYDCQYWDEAGCLRPCESGCVYGHNAVVLRECFVCKNSFWISEKENKPLERYYCIVCRKK